MTLLGYQTTPDGSIIDNNEKLVVFSENRFVNDICEGDNCFICGTSKSKTPFNDEHVIPNWMLRNLSLHTEHVRLGNETDFRYSHYKIPCCESCNTLMGRDIETPIKSLLSKNSFEIDECLRREGAHLLYTWLALIFFKIHLRNRSFRMDRNQKNSSKQIADYYEWRSFYILHCIARSFYTGVHLSNNAMGSLFVLPCRTIGVAESFDFCALYGQFSMFIRFRRVAIYVSFYDACLGVNLMESLLQRIEASADGLNEIQAWEVFSELAESSSRLVKRPQFYIAEDIKNKQYFVHMELDTPTDLRPMSTALRGDILYRGIRGKLQDIEISGVRGVEAEELIRRGHVSFLLDDSGSLVPANTLRLNRR